MLNRSDRGEPEGLSTDLRSPFQRDRDRILYSEYFRRLAGVTQVTSPQELATFHNRLTHTLEVAQVARRIAERFDHDPQIDPDVVEAAALAHDLGHPPFGHSGEKTLDELARSNGLDDGYEGNAQSLRILTGLAVRSELAPGLNLTAATLRASIKYPWLRGGNPDKPKKFGVYADEREVFEALWEGLPAMEQTIEAQIMDWADDIAYSTHDFYDFAISGLIPVADLKASRELLSHVAADGDLPYQPDILSVAIGTLHQSFTLLPERLGNRDSRLSSAKIGSLKAWVSYLIRRYAAEAPDHDGSRLAIPEHIQCEVAILKRITYHFAIGAPALAVRQHGERKILSGLFEILLDDLEGDKRLFSEDSRARVELGTHPVRVVLDTISGMSDTQAATTYHKLSGVAPISILDLTTTSSF